MTPPLPRTPEAKTNRLRRKLVNAAAKLEKAERLHDVAVAHRDACIREATGVLNMREIGDALGLSHQRVAQIVRSRRLSGGKR